MNTQNQSVLYIALSFIIFVLMLVIFSLSKISISFVTINVILFSIVKVGMFLLFFKCVLHIKDSEKGLVDSNWEPIAWNKNTWIAYFIAWFIILFQLMFIASNFSF